MSKHNRRAEAEQLLNEVETWCARTGTKETAIGHKLFLHPGFVGGMRKRLTVSAEKEEAVRCFLAAHADGYHGSLPKTHANGTRPVGPERLQPELKPIPRGTHREPCGFCGVRSDIGCTHRKIAA